MWVSMTAAPSSGGGGGGGGGRRRRRLNDGMQFEAGIFVHPFPAHHRFNSGVRGTQLTPPFPPSLFYYHYLYDSYYRYHLLIPPCID